MKGHLFNHEIGMDLNLHKKALLLSYFTVMYNMAEGTISLIVGSIGGSIALVGFGLDSFIESSSALVMVWRFRKHGRISEEEEEKIENRATKLVGYTFFLLGGYILYVSGKKLYLNEIPESYFLGILIAGSSLIVMPLLFYLKYQTGKKLGSKSLVADSKETLACLFMSVALLVGLGVHYLYGFWQADPVVGIIIAGFLINEGSAILRK